MPSKTSSVFENKYKYNPDYKLKYKKWSKNAKKLLGTQKSTKN